MLTLGNIPTLAAKREKKKKIGRKSGTAADAVEAVAKLVDPAAWGEQPVASVIELEAQVRDLTEEIERHVAIVTTPEGEYRIIRHRKRPLPGDRISTLERQQAAYERAKLILATIDATKKSYRIKMRNGGRALVTFPR